MYMYEGSFLRFVLAAWLVFGSCNGTEYLNCWSRAHEMGYTYAFKREQRIISVTWAIVRQLQSQHNSRWAGEEILLD